MILTITSLELRNPFQFFVFANYARKNVKQLKGSSVVKFKSRGFWTSHYTMTLWNNKEEMREFATTGAHLDAMKNSKKFAKVIRTLTYEEEQMPAWSEAKALLIEKGRELRYD